MVALAPLSHFLRLSLTDPKRSFLDLVGAPLLRACTYALTG